MIIFVKLVIFSFLENYRTGKSKLQAVELATSHPNGSTKTWHQPRGGTARHSLANAQLAEPVVAPGVDSGLGQSQAVLLSSGNLGNAQAWKSLEQGNLGRN